MFGILIATTDTVSRFLQQTDLRNTYTQMYVFIGRYTYTIMYTCTYLGI